MGSRPPDRSGPSVGTPGGPSRRRVLGALGGTALLGLGVGGGTARGKRSDQGTLEPTGRLVVPRLSEVVPGADGTTVYGAVPEGFVTIDVTDPSDPTMLAEVTGILAEHEDGPLSGVFDVSVDGDRLAVGGPRGAFLDGVKALAVYDVSDPTEPVQLAAGEIGHAVHNLELAGGTVYSTGHGYPTGPLVAHDAADLAERWRWSVLDVEPAWGVLEAGYHTCHDVVVRDGLAYAAFWDAGTRLLDVAGDSPVHVGAVGGVEPSALPAPGGPFELPGNAHYAAPMPDRPVLAVGKEAGDSPASERKGGPGGIHLWDIADPAEPELLSMLPPVRTPDGAGHTAHNFGFRGSRCYASWYAGGVRVYDLADPTAPRDLGGFQAPETTSFWTARPIHEGFVAPSFRDPSLADSREGATLLTFPEPPAGASGEPVRSPTPTPGPTPPPTRTPSPTATLAPPSTSPGSAPSTTYSPEPTPTPSETGGTATPTRAAPQTQTGSSGSVPGFGVLAALGGLGVAAWRRATRD